MYFISHLTWVCYVYLKWEGSLCPLASPSPQLTSRCDLLCDGIVNCGQEIFSIDESPEVCRSRVKSSPGLGSPRTPSWPRSLSWSASPSSPQGRCSAAANIFAKTNRNKIVLSLRPIWSTAAIRTPQLPRPQQRITRTVRHPHRGNVASETLTGYWPLEQEQAFGELR